MAAAEGTGAWEVGVAGGGGWEGGCESTLKYKKNFKVFTLVRAEVKIRLMLIISSSY